MSDPFYSGRPNRVVSHAAEVEGRISERLQDPDARAAFEAEMAVSFEEHFRFQEWQARAHLQGLLSTDEALTVYNALGEVGDPVNGGWAAGTSLALKVSVTLLMGEIGARLVRS